MLLARSTGGDVTAWSCGTPGWRVTTATKQGMAVPTEGIWGGSSSARGMGRGRRQGKPKELVFLFSGV